MITERPAAAELERTNRRLHALREAALALNADLSLKNVLQRLIDIARELVPARYAALMVLAPDGSLAHFITGGLTSEQADAIGTQPRGQGLLGVPLQEGRSVRVARLADDPRASGLPPHHPALSSLLGVPLLAGGRVTGGLYLANQEGEGGFTDEDQMVLEMFGAHATIAIENARLYTEARQAAVAFGLLNQVNSRVRASLNLHEVLDRTTQELGEALAADRCFVLLPTSGPEAPVFAEYVRPGTSPLGVGQAPRLPVSQGATERQRTRAIDDLEQAAEVDGSADGRADLAGVRAVLATPMLCHGQVIGTITLHQASPRHWQPWEVGLVEAVAGEAAVAVLNAREHRGVNLALERRVQQVMALVEVGQSLSAHLDVEAMLRRAVRGAVRALDATAGLVALREGEELVPREWWNGRRWQTADARWTRGEGCLGRVWASGRPHLAIADGTHACSVPGLAAWNALRFCLSVPIVDRRGEFQGVIAVGSGQRPLGEDDIPILQEVGRQTAVALENARLYTESERQREFLERLIESLPIGVAVVSGPEFRHELVNPAYSTIPGRRNRRMVGHTLAEVFPDIAARGLEALNQAYRTGKPARLSEYRASVGPGREHTYWNVELVPLRGPAGPVESVLIITHDVTEEVVARKRIEELARQAEVRAAELVATIQSSAEAIYVVDVAGRFTLVNPAGLELLGCDSVEALQQSLPQLDERLEIRDPRGTRLSVSELPLFRALAGEQVAPLDLRFLWLESAQESFLRASATPIRGESGQLAGAVSILTDISALKRLDRAKDEFISIASHELKTPLTVVKGHSQLLLRRALKQPDQPPDPRPLEIMNQQIDRMAWLIEELLDVSRIRSGKLQLEFTPVDLNSLVRRVVDSQRVMAVGHRFDLHLPPAPVIGQWDAGRLEQAILNLVTNAIKYSPRAGVVEVAVRPEGGATLLTVRDHGIGIPPEARRQLFTPFFRAANVRGSTFSGLGLGLYIVHQIVTGHQGQIWVRSEPGKGTTFFLRLPLQPPGEASAGDT